MKNKSISIVFPFRSFHNQQFNFRVGLFYLLPLVFNGIILFFLSQIMQGWGFLIELCLAKLKIGSVIYTQYTIFHINFLLPSIVLTASPPSSYCWWWTFCSTLVIFGCSFWLKNSLTPLKYLLRAFLFILCCSLVYFYIHPNYFPYDIALFTKSGFLQILALLIATPWIFCFAYYNFGYRFVAKIALTALTINYLIILAPFQYLLNALLIHYCSLIIMPGLYFFFGLLTNIMAIIAFYAYGISMEYSHPKYKLYKTPAAKDN